MGRGPGPICSWCMQIYYTDDSKIREDPEIMGWWREIQEKGHPDKKTGWPALQTVGDLTDIITTMAWIASGHHAAVNFGQYSYRWAPHACTCM